MVFILFWLGYSLGWLTISGINKNDDKISWLDGSRIVIDKEEGEFLNSLFFCYVGRNVLLLFLKNINKALELYKNLYALLWEVLMDEINTKRHV